jgi:hypothetical protein
MRFGRGNRHGKGGKRSGAGRKTNAELNAKAARLAVWERELTKWDAKHAKRFCQQAMEDNSVLLSARKAVIPDAKQEINLNGGLKIVRVNAFNPDE